MKGRARSENSSPFKFCAIVFACQLYSFIDMSNARSEDVIYYNSFESNSPLFIARLLLTGFAFCTPGETEEMTVPLNFAQVLFSTRGVRMFAPALYAAPRAFSSCQVLLRGNFENFGLNLDIAVFTNFHANCISFYTRSKCQFANNFKLEFNLSQTALAYCLSLILHIRVMLAQDNKS